MKIKLIYHPATIYYPKRKAKDTWFDFNFQRKGAL